MKSFRTLLGVLACLAFTTQACAADNVLPAIPGPGGPIMAQPVVNIGYDSGTGLPCVVGATATCVLSTVGGGGGSGGATATALAPTRIEGSTNQPASQDLHGSQRTLLLDSSGTALDFTTPTGVKGSIASGSTASDPPVTQGCRAATAAPTAVTDGQVVNAMCGVEGKQVVLPYAIKELALRGSASTTANTATTLIAAQGASVKTYITGLQCSNTSATTTYVTMNDSASSVFIVPAGGGSNVVFNVPLVTAANTALTFTAASAVTTMYCNAQGYAGP